MMRSTKLTLAASFILFVSAKEAVAEESISLSKSHNNGEVTLIANLSSPDPTVRLDAVRTLGSSGNLSAIEPLTQSARSDPSPEIRGLAMRALSEFGTPEAIETLRFASQSDVDQQVRSLASQLLNTHSAASPPTTTVSQPSPAQSPSSRAVIQQSAQSQMAIEPQQRERYDITLRRVRGTGRGFRLGGWLTFSTAYTANLLTMVVGIYTNGAGNSILFDLIPLVGPVISGGMLFASADNCGGTNCASELNNLGIASLVFSFAQIAGFTLAIVGHSRRRRARRTLLGGRGELRRHLAVTPTSSRDGVGLAIAGRF